MNKDFIGKWKITQMDGWDMDYVDMVVPGYFRFDDDGTGEFQFGCVHGRMDCYDLEIGSRIDFSWDGNDEMEEANGRGWVEVNGNKMKGHIYLHRFSKKLKEVHYDLQSVRQGMDSRTVSQRGFQTVGHFGGSDGCGQDSTDCDVKPDG